MKYIIVSPSNIIAVGPFDSKPAAREFLELHSDLKGESEEDRPSIMAIVEAHTIGQLYHQLKEERT
jgi:hypothetical protein